MVSFAVDTGAAALLPAHVPNVESRGARKGLSNSRQLLIRQPEAADSVRDNERNLGRLPVTSVKSNHGGTGKVR